MKRFWILLSVILLISVSIWIFIAYNKTTDEYRYGNSLNQNRIVNAIRLHKFGISGERIKIGVIDAGFNTEAAVFLKTKIVEKYDFVRNKKTVIDYDYMRGMDHGTNVLSVVGGYKENELIGVAYGADFLLARTDISTDRLYEEEFIAAEASRWMYSNGVNIITTSLSFNKFDNAEFYYPLQMNGAAAVITRTADSLAGKGIIYFSSAGNNYEDQWRIIEAPGDGFNVLCIGSIDKNLKHSFFSSCGPTADGRIKPDLVAPGEGVWNANYLPKLKPEFGWNHGTSLAAPIAAGVAALVWSAHPGLTSAQVTEAVIKTASKADSPDNLYGYGIPDAEKAVSYFGPAFSNTPQINYDDDLLSISTHVFSSNGVDESSVEIYFTGINKNEYITKMKRTDDFYYTADIKIESRTEKVYIYFKAKDKRGFINRYPSGMIGDSFLIKIDRNTNKPSIQTTNYLK